LKSWSFAHLDAGANHSMSQKKGFGVRNKKASTNFLEVARAAPSQASSCQPGSERELEELAVKFEESDRSNPGSGKGAWKFSVVGESGGKEKKSKHKSELVPCFYGPK